MNPHRYSRYYIYIKPVIQNPLVKSLAPYIFSLLTITFFIIFVIRPTILTIFKLEQDIKNNQQVLAALNQKAESLNIGKQNLERLDQAVKLKIDQALPDQPQVTFLIQSLQEAIGTSASASALQVQPLTLIDTTIPPKTTFSLAEINFSFSVQGPYPELLTVLANLNKSPRVTTIENMVIGKQEGALPVLSVSGKGYFLK